MAGLIAKLEATKKEDALAQIAKTNDIFHCLIQ